MGGHSPRQPPSLLRTAVLLTVALSVGVVWSDGVSRVVEYRSPLDDSMQAYGVYLPEAPPPGDAGYPAVLHGHGYGWRVSARFSSFQRQWAEERGWVMIHLNARGPNFYEGVGDLETLKVVDHAAAHFGLDRDRIYMTGGSMGGTGALRHGLRHPDVFAAVMGVDGWTDFRLWHHHWYARTDYRDLIEEFRRPLLQAASPLYWAERGELGAVGHIVDGSDTTVLPENGLRLHQRLRELKMTDPGSYDHRLIFNPTLGHGRGTDYRAIYGFFIGRERVARPRRFHIKTPVVQHGQLYWGRIDDLLIDGMSGSLEASADDDVIWVRTGNLRAFTLQPGGSPAAEARWVKVIADGFPCYEGPPETVTLAADLDAAGGVVGWRVRTPPDPLHKHPGLSGPIGDAFLQPFVVSWAADGPADEVERHRLEAEQFARDWNRFMVHGPVLKAVAESRLSRAQIATRNVILFGSLDTSSLLRRADAALSFPVRISSDGVIVRDPARGERRYMGEKYGALMVYPNPLSDFSTYLVVANRRLYTKPDGGSPQLLGYDLEKLPWAYPDYVIFNNDQSELPFVLNVNNKPPVTCYEAACFVEVGYFDDAWQIDRRRQLRRTHRQKPEDHRFMHVGEVCLNDAAARVRIIDASGEPVHTARVTGRWWGRDETVASASTDEDGVADFPAPGGEQRDASFEVVSVMATGCTYDWTADAVRGLAPGPLSPGRLDLTVVNDRPAVEPDGALGLRLVTHNAAKRARSVSIALRAPSGRIIPSRCSLDLLPGSRGEADFTWWPKGRRPGTAVLRAEAHSLHGDSTASCRRSVPVTVVPGRGLPIAIGEVEASDIERGEPWKVSTTLRHVGDCSDIQVTVHCALMEAHHYAAAKNVTVEPGGSMSVGWTGDERLPKGEHTVRVTVDGGYGITRTGEFAVR